MAFGVQVGSPNTADTLPLAFEIILDQRAETTVLIPEVWVYLQMRFTVEPKDTQPLFQKKFTAKLPASEAIKP